jgi:hypothetical protein
MLGVSIMVENDIQASEPVYDPSIGSALREAAHNISELTSYSAQKKLTPLSPKTTFTGIDVYEDAIFRASDNSYTAPVTIYIELRYPKSKTEPVVGESFPGRVIFKMTEGKVTIIDITADTSSFSN